MIDDDIDPMDLDPLQCLTEADQIELISWQWDPDWTPPPIPPIPPSRAKRVWTAVATFETVLGILTLSAGTLLMNAEGIPLVVAFIVSAVVYGLAKLWFDVPSPQHSEVEAPPVPPEPDSANGLDQAVQDVVEADVQLLMVFGIPVAQLGPQTAALARELLGERHQ